MRPTERTLALLRDRGWLVATVERWIPGACIRRDAFGWIDIIALDPASRTIWGVQSTGTDFAGHRHKLLGEARAMVASWLHCGGKALLIGWREVKRPGSPNQRSSEPRIEEFTEATLMEEMLK